MLSVGIDYGTNNSAIAFDVGNGAQIIPWPDKGRTGPSVVYLPPNSPDCYVGRQALTEGKENADYCFRHAKRFFAVPATGEDMGHQKAKGPDGNVWFRGPDKLYSPTQLAYCVIDEMLEYAEFRLQHRPDSAVLTHPAGFGEDQKRCLTEAGQLAGLKTIRLLAEPSAAAFAYKFHLGNIRHYLIYDWGGGTFDVAIPHAGKGSVDTKHHTGLQVGGIDVDEAIVDWMKEAYRLEHGVDLGEDNNAVDRLRAAAEQAKIALSTRDSYKIEIPLIQTIPARTLTATLTVEKLEELAAPFIAKTIECCAGLLELAGLTLGNISDVILVGGMTNMPCVARAVAEWAGKKPRNEIDPDEAVALGAATFAAMFLDKSTKPAKIIERAPHDFGFETSNGVFHKVITKGTVYPLKQPITVTITSEADGQAELSLHVLEGDGFRAGETRRLATHDFPAEPAPAGEPSVDIVFNIDANGKRTVTGPDGLIFEGIGNV